MGSLTMDKTYQCLLHERDRAYRTLYNTGKRKLLNFKGKTKRRDQSRRLGMRIAAEHVCKQN